MAKEKKNPKSKDVKKERRPLPSGVHRAIPIILGAVAVFIAVCFIMDGVGELGGSLADILMGLFSYGAYGIPVLLAVHAVFYASDIKEKRLLSRVIFSLLALISISAAIFTIQNFGAEPEFLGFGYYEAGIAGSGGGLIGSLIAYGIAKLFGFVGVIIIALAMLCIYITYFFSGGGRTLRAIGFNLLKWTVTFCAFVERGIKRVISFFFGFGKRSRQKRSVERSRALYEDDFFAVDNGIESLEISELGIAERRSREAIEARPTLHEKVFHKNDPERRDRAPIGSAVHTDIWVDSEELSHEPEAAKGKPTSDSADAIFTKDFDPFDIAASEELANKPSTKSASKSEPTVTERLDDISAERTDRAEKMERMERELEETRRKLEEAERRKAAPVVNTPDSPEEKRKTFEFTETRTETLVVHEEEESFSLTVEKSEDRAPERYRSEFIENTYGDTPYYSESDDVVTLERHADKASPEAPIFKSFDIEEEEEQKLIFRENGKSEPDSLTVERSYVGDIADDDNDEEEDIYTDALPEEEAFSDEEIPEEEQNPVISGYRDMFGMFKSDKAEEPLKEAEEEPLPFERFTPKEAPKTQKPDAHEPKRASASRYVLPPLDLLGLEGGRDDDEINAEIKQNAEILLQTLADFGVTASLVGVDRGPRITRYEIIQARGIQLKEVTKHFTDIVQNLGTDGVRMEAPIPGKKTIGFEVPNKHPSNVRLRELLECEEFANAKSKTFVCIGKDVAGTPVFGDIAKFPHALVAGATGMGKSVCINSIMISMLYKVRPDEVKFIMIDPKKVEFRMYSGIPHLLIPVITEAKQAAGALMWAVEEMERRYSLIEQNNVRNIEGYNEKCSHDKSLEPLPKIVIVIDELNDLMMQVRDPVEDLIMRIVQKARAAGIHLIIGTQRPDVKVVTGTIKANINTRISCKVTSVVDSRTILDMAGAEKLLDRGDMLFKPVDKTTPIRVQGCFVSDSEVENIMDFLKSNNEENVYNEEVFAEINRAAQKCGNKKSHGDDFDDDGGSECGYYSDQQFLDAVELAIRSGKISTSLLQRKLSIGYGKAAKYIDAMEEIGVVSEQNGMKPREVLISMDEWHEKLSRVEFD